MPNLAAYITLEWLLIRVNDCMLLETYEYL